MEKFLFNINSTSWFHTLKSGKVVKLEVYLLLICFASFFGAIGAGYENAHDEYFGTTYRLLTLPFVIVVAEYLLYAAYSIFIQRPSMEIVNSFWKTNLWRLRNPSYYFQKTVQYDNPKEVQDELEYKWEEHYGETTETTLKSAPWIQKYRFIILLIMVFLGIMIGQNL